MKCFTEVTLKCIPARSETQKYTLKYSDTLGISRNLWVMEECLALGVSKHTITRSLVQSLVGMSACCSHVLLHLRVSFLVH